MITVNRSYDFCASHRLHLAMLNEAENDELFGKCNNPFGHGHNYRMEISVSGAIDGQTGRAVDLETLDALVADHVVARYDHRYLNEELAEFEHLVPTTENLGSEIRKRLEAVWLTAFPTGQPGLMRIRIFETERNIIEIVGSEAIKT